MVISKKAEVSIFEAMKRIVAAPVIVCAWCPGFVPNESISQSHGICKSCAARLDAALDKLEANMR